MKMLFCTDLLLETMCSSISDYDLSVKWRELRCGKFRNVLDNNSDISYVALLGRVFGDGLVREKMFSSFFEVVSAHNNIKFLAFLNDVEYKRISYRKDIPNNLYILNIKSSDKFSDTDIILKTHDNNIEFLLKNNMSIGISNTEENKFYITYNDKKEELLHFEATGYEDFRHNFGYSFIDFGEEGVKEYKTVENCMFSYGIVELVLSLNDKDEDIAEKIIENVVHYKFESIVRINLTGTVDRNVVIDTSELALLLRSKVFYVEICDNTIVNFDEEFREDEASLKREFLQTVIHEESLSDSEKSKIIRCGLNELERKEATTDEINQMSY